MKGLVDDVVKVEGAGARGFATRVFGVKDGASHFVLQRGLKLSSEVETKALAQLFDALEDELPGRLVLRLFGAGELAQQVALASLLDGEKRRLESIDTGGAALGRERLGGWAP
ncbi:MAG: hypothetical protein KAI66_20835 [Lentisphaeria bacterium]|nr:hypothetical protein [Lentisphaeria bacterium]